MKLKQDCKFYKCLKLSKNKISDDSVKYNFQLVFFFDGKWYYINYPFNNKIKDILKSDGEDEFFCYLYNNPLTTTLIVPYKTPTKEKEKKIYETENFIETFCYEKIEKEEFLQLLQNLENTRLKFEGEPTDVFEFNRKFCKVVVDNKQPKIIITNDLELGATSRTTVFPDKRINTESNDQQQGQDEGEDEQESEQIVDILDQQQVDLNQQLINFSQKTQQEKHELIEKAIGLWRKNVKKQPVTESTVELGHKILELISDMKIMKTKYEEQILRMNPSAFQTVD